MLSRRGPEGSVRRNFILNVLDGVFYFGGSIFIAPESVIPVLIAALGGNAFHISLVPVLRTLGFFLPSLFVVSHVGTLPRKKWFVTKLGLIQRLPYLILGLVTLLFAVDRPTLTLVVLMVVVLMNAVGGGLVIPPYFYLSAKTIPVKLRGRLFALRNIASYLLGVAAGGLITTIIAAVSYPKNYATLVFIGLGVMLLSVPCIILMVEPDAKRTSKAIPLRQVFSLVREALAGHSSLRWYVTGRMLYALSFASFSYFAVYFISKFDLPSSTAGIFTIVIAATFIVMNPLFGYLADKRGHLKNHTIAMLCMCAGNIVALLSPWYALSFVAIALGAVTNLNIALSGFALPMEFCDEHEIPLYIATVGLFVGLASIIILAMGLAAKRWGYEPIYVLCGITSLLSAAIFHFKVVEPRTTSREVA